MFTVCRIRLNNHNLPIEYNTDDGTTYLGNSEFAIYATQQILEMSSKNVVIY
jgi:hypothetical protein